MKNKKNIFKNHFILIILLSIVSMFFFNKIYAQNADFKVEWDKTFGFHVFDEANSIIQTIDCGYAVAGYTYSTEKSFDSWVIKIDKYGNRIWDKIFGGNKFDGANSIIQTTDGGYAVAGYTESKGAGDDDFWIIKLDKHGNKIWDKTFGGNSNDIASSIIQTTDGGYAVAGYTKSKGAGDNDFWIIKLDKNGNITWDKTFGGSGMDNALSIIQTANGGYVVAGNTSKRTGESDFWVIKLDKNGIITWDKTFGGRKDDIANSIIQTTDGGYAVAGNTSKRTGECDFWVIKLDENGNKIWDKIFGGEKFDGANSIIHTTDGGYAAAGYKNGDNSLVVAEKSDFWVIKLDKNGNKIWDKTFGGNNKDVANSIIQATDGGYVVAGYTESKGAGKSDFWIIKIGGNNINEKIKLYVKEKIKVWQQKDKFEKTIDYQKRVNETTRNKKIKFYTQQAINELAKKEINWNDITNDYDADNEVYKLTLKNFNPIYIKVPIEEAKIFNENFKQIEYKNPKFTLVNNNFNLLHVEIFNPANSKTYYYNNNEISAFSSTQLSLNFDEINITIPKQQVEIKKINETVNTITIGKSDVDLNIPKTNEIKTNTYALIIGNEDYQSYQTGLKTEQNVEYAVNDAEIFKKYCIQTLGIPKDNIIFEQNAGVVRMKQSLNQINSVIKNTHGNVKVIVYYAGHGFPDELTKEPYLIPVDVTASNLDLSISLKEMYKKLTEYPSKEVIVFLDACFTGGGREVGLLATRGVKIKPKENLLQGNIVVFNASSKDQTALPYKEKGHGMFTYYLLKKMKDTKGEVTLGELYNYIEQQVSIRSPMLNKQEQNPKVNISPRVKDVWEDWLLK